MKSTSYNIFSKRWLIVLALLLPAFLLYFKSIFFDFTVLDEQWIIINNADNFAKPDSWLAALIRPVLKLYHRPILMLSLLADFKVNGTAPLMFHITNLVLHLACSYLVFLFLTTFGTSRQAAFAMALLFSLHPTALQAVAWVPGRNDSLLCLFSLASFIALKNYTNSSKISALVAHATFFLIALFTKENAISLPIIYLFILSYLKNGLTLKKTILYGGIYVATVGAWWWLRCIIIEPKSFQVLDTGTSVLNFFQSLLLYISKIILPVNLSVMPTLSNHFVLPGLFTLAIIVVCWYKIDTANRKNAGLGLVIFVVALALPVWYSAVRTSGELYEHRLYLAMSGMCLFFGQVPFNYAGNKYKIAITLIAAIYFLMSWQRMTIYKNKILFIQTAVKEWPDYFYFNYQMGEYLNAKGDFSGAVQYLNKALDKRKDIGIIYNDRATAYYGLGRYAEALEDYNKAIAISDFTENMYFNRCLTHARLNNFAKAIYDLKVIEACCASSIPVEMSKNIYLRWEELLKDLDTQIALYPKDANLYFKKSQLYFDSGDRQKGFENIYKCLNLDSLNSTYVNYYNQQLEGLKTESKR